MTDELTFTGIPQEELAERYRKIRAIFELGEALGCPNLLRDAIEGDQFNDARYPWVQGTYYEQIRVSGMHCDLDLNSLSAPFDAGGNLCFKATRSSDLYLNLYPKTCFILRINPGGEVAGIEEVTLS